MARKKQKAAKIAGFITKLIQILKSKEHEQVVFYDEQQRSFTIKNVRIFTEQILPSYFKHRNYSSFVRQVNLYNFHKIRQEGKEEAYHHQFFEIDNGKELKKIKRKPMVSQKNRSSKRDADSSQDSEQEMDQVQNNDFDSSNQRQRDGVQGVNEKEESQNVEIQELQRKKNFLQNKIRLQQTANQKLEHQNNRLRHVFQNENLQFYQQLLKILQNLLISQYNQQQINHETYHKLIRYIYEEKKILEQDEQLKNHHNSTDKVDKTLFSTGISRESKFLSLVKEILASDKHHFTIPYFIQILVDFTEKQENSSHPEIQVNNHIVSSPDNQAALNNSIPNGRKNNSSSNSNLSEQRPQNADGEQKSREKSISINGRQNNQNGTSNNKRIKNKKKDSGSADEDYVPKYR